ncbi:MAG: hypothetical protein NDJ92_17800 [Thermoanaerobaculia bacterium]|nr:hypothetical protein [Thermoanaerobaculia bacterium]
MGLMIRTLFTVVFTVVFAVAAFAQDELPTEIRPEEALQRAAQLRSEAVAHREMEREVAAQTGGSRRDRNWRKTMVALCREYAEAANRAAEAYEKAAAPDSVASPAELRPHTMLPVTEAEYAARASDYEVQAESLRADADRYLSMLRSSRTASLQESVYGSGRGAGQLQSGGWFEPLGERAGRERWEEVVQQNLDLAREASNVAKHFRLRARQLKATR